MGPRVSGEHAHGVDINCLTYAALALADMRGAWLAHMGLPGEQAETAEIESRDR